MAINLKNTKDIDQLKRLKEDDLIYNRKENRGIKGVGTEIAQSIVSFFQDENNLNHIEGLFKSGIHLKGFSPDERTPLTGKTLVITGTLKNLKRSAAREQVIRMGGRLASSISRTTDYLVAGESPGSKLQRAKDLEIPILDEEKFLKLLKKD